MRNMPNGDIIFPARGPIPTQEIEGYIQDENDPYIYRMCFVKCAQRELQKRVRCEYGKIKIVDFCNALGVVITPKACKDCNHPLKG